MTHLDPRMKRKALKVVGALLIVVAIGVAATVLSRRDSGRSYSRVLSLSHEVADLLSLYEHFHDALPYTDTGSVREYLSELRRDIKGREFARVQRSARYLVYVNMKPEEWKAVRSCLAEKRRGGGVLMGWSAKAYVVYGRTRRTALYWLPGGVVARPDDDGSLRREVARLDEAVREALGKSLVDCLIYEKGKFDPSLLEPENGSPPASNRPTDVEEEQ